MGEKRNEKTVVGGIKMRGYQIQKKGQILKRQSMRMRRENDGRESEHQPSISAAPRYVFLIHLKFQCSNMR